MSETNFIVSLELQYIEVGHSEMSSVCPIIALITATIFLKISMLVIKEVKVSL
jgi:hypothetical protein